MNELMGERAPDPEDGKPSGNALSTEQRIERLESAVKKVADSLMQERSEYGKSGGTSNIAEKRGDLNRGNPPST